MTTTPAPGSRRLVLAGAVSVALISTGSAYLAMVAFGLDVLGMSPAVAFTTAGVFELSLITVALLAREAARDNRPGGTLLTLTWVLSSASGGFAAWHELYIGHEAGAAFFRFLVPLLAALMWHLALIGDRHLATGRTWTQVRAGGRMHALFLATEDLYRAQAADDGTHTARRRIARAEAARRRARAVALRTVPPDQMRATVTAWLDSMRAVGEGTADTASLFTEDTARLARILTAPMSGLSVPDTRHLSAPVSADLSALVSGSLSAPVSAAGQTRPVVRATVGPAVRTDKPRTVRRSVRPAGPANADKAARLAIVSALVAEDPAADSAAALAALTAAGHDVTDRTARRDLETVRAGA
ncbi:hypothetical protein L1785_14495 [Antribacter sp. KLBMP9083]|uniref:DUF2637 domain-containing protein n=1 Tax=Antribacter soli TaxID=2910976 RepID=A0AA41QHC3_9MICO|nr:hypothetical protein [Antribacter soli]MCF4122187.1 hypothetical protein [Antribacter soli]